MSQNNDEPNVLEFLGLSVEALEDLVQGASQLEDNQQLFEQLASISKAKKLVEDALEEVLAVETEAKGLINAKAKALYGHDWQAIKGKGYKISRQQTGAVYEFTDPEKVADEFVKIKMDPNAATITNYRETHDNALPKGVGLNEHRGESIRVAVT